MPDKKTRPVEDKVHKELEMVKGMLARALADYDNLSKRVERERQDLGKLASVGIIIKLLPILDNLESEEGLTEIRPEMGSKFNEEIMEAIEVVKGESDNVISEVVLVGWKFEDGTVVRHAKVKVSKK
jgi:molecular chaperone GrpE (heat shock protein)